MLVQQTNMVSGDFNASDAFVDFTQNTNQKDVHARIMQDLHGQLALAILDRQKPLYFVDLACGDGQASAAIIEGLNKVFPGKTHYFGFDIEPRFLDKTRKNFMNVRTPNLASISLSQADLFSPHFPFLHRGVNNVMATIGHVLYYGGDRIPQFAENLKKMLGDGNNLCDLTHNGQNCELATIRAQFAKNIIAQPSGIFAEAAEACGLEVQSFVATSKLYFPQLSEAQWDVLKDPEQWEKSQLIKDDEFKKALSLTSFITQQALPVPSNVTLIEIQSSHPRLTLKEYQNAVEQIQNLISRKDKPYIEIHSEYQIAYPTASKSPQLPTLVRQAIEHVEAQLPEIQRQAEETYKSRHENNLQSVHTSQQDPKPLI